MLKQKRKVEDGSVVSGVKENLGLKKMKNHLYLKVSVDCNALISGEILCLLIHQKESDSIFASYYAGEGVA